MNKAFEKILVRLEELRETYDEMAFIEMNTNGHTLDFEYAKGKKDVMLDVKKIVQEVAEEYKNGHFGCNFNGEHEKCKDCCITNCKKRNTIWFGLDAPDTNVGTKWIPCKKALEMSAPALEKQMPIKAIITGHNNAINTDIGRCPICNGVELRACDHNYCPDCGQKLKWSDEE